MATAFPVPEDDDAEDVAWGLTTGAALWRQGERYDAIVWLKRAVEAANEAGASARADQLNRAATDLIAALAVPPQTSAPQKSKSPPSPQPRPPAVPAAQPPRAPSPPSMRKAAPVPPKPPPPPKARTPTPSQASITPAGDVPPRAPMPSVTTSAPPMEALTRHAAPIDEPPPHEAPPPPTIVPDVAFDLTTSTPPPPSPVPPPVAPTSAGDPRHDPSRKRTSRPPPALIAALDALPLTISQKRVLSETATIESISGEEDIGVSCLALVVDGQASAQPTVADVTAVSLRAGELLYAKSPIAETLSLRLVAEADPTTIALWDHGADEVLASTPELLEQLKRSSGRTQAIAGFTMGPVGERLDEALRAVAIDRLEMRVLAPNEVIASAGNPVPGMVIVGVGAVELEGENGDNERLGPGDFLFATEVLGGGLAPTTARAGSRGAIVLFGARGVAHELLVTCPPLLEVFAGM